MTRDVGKVVGPVVAVIVGLIVAAAVVWWLFLRPDLKRFRAPSEAMVPTIPINDRFMVDQDAYDDGEAPKVGEIVVFHPPAGAIGETGQRCGDAAVTESRLCARPVKERADVTFVKRVVAGPGDRLAVRRGKAIVNGRPLDEPYAQPCEAGAGCDFSGEITIPDGHFFGMGDNRGQSDDSRFWGPVPTDWLVGRVEDCSWLGIGCSPLR
jgi:signal peptidase I